MPQRKKKNASPNKRRGANSSALTRAASAAELKPAKLCPKHIGGRGLIGSPVAAQMLEALRANPFPDGYAPEDRPKTVQRVKSTSSLASHRSTRSSSSQGARPTPRASNDRSRFLISSVKNGNITVGMPSAENAGMSNFLVENSGFNRTKYRPKSRGGLISFGSASRFPNKETASGPGPKYHPHDSHPDGLIQTGPAFGFGTGKPSRSTFMTTVIRNGVLLTQANSDAGSNQAGPAAYHPSNSSTKDQHPRVVWGKSGDKRFKTNKNLATPGPKYFNAIKPGPGVALGPKPQAEELEFEESMKTHEELRLKSQRGQKLRETLCLQETMRMSQQLSPSNRQLNQTSTTWAKRLPKTIYMGHKFGLKGFASPGPAYNPVASSYAKPASKQFIPAPKGWNPTGR